MKKLDFIIERYGKFPDWTLSRFYFDGAFSFMGYNYSFEKKLMGYGIEDELRKEKVHGETAIDEGEYRLSLTDSPKFSKSYYVNNIGELLSPSDVNALSKSSDYQNYHKLILINGTPRHSRVLVHWGNTDKDTEGCYIVGSSVGKIGNRAAVLGSRRKYVEIYPIIYRAIMSKSIVTMKIY